MKKTVFKVWFFFIFYNKLYLYLFGMTENKEFELDGASLTVETLDNIINSNSKGRIKLSNHARDQVQRGRNGVR